MPCPDFGPSRIAFDLALDLLALYSRVLFAALTVRWIDLFLDSIITICEIADIKTSASALRNPLAIIFYLNALFYVIATHYLCVGWSIITTSRHGDLYVREKCFLHNLKNIFPYRPTPVERRALACDLTTPSAHMHHPNARRPQAVAGIRVRRLGVPGHRNGGWGKAAMALAPALGACSAGDKPDRPRGPRDRIAGMG